MNRSFILVLFMLAAFGIARGQWDMQQANSTAGLRGIHSVDGTVAWASGADGTVLRTEDGGSHWQKCAIPPEAEKLDLRGVWAWDAKTAIVMSAGPGGQSRLYKTDDGCAHWTEEAQNSEKDGFWDAVAFQTQDFGTLEDQKTGVLIGDPVREHFYTEVMIPGHGWSVDDGSCAAVEGEGAFAASNSSVFVFGSGRYILVTGGKLGARALLSPLLAYNDGTKGCLAVSIPLASGSDASGAFSVNFRDAKHGVVVGGDYKMPNDSSGTAAWTADGGRHWTAASKPPHGYRSAVAWDASAKVWIAAGYNGSDISHDGGKTWQRLDDGDWNALSPPYIVGPNGRIGKLRAGAVKR
jgi:photosystem II stability/assembly factor-like uncharacterized protein